MSRDLTLTALVELIGNPELSRELKRLEVMAEHLRHDYAPFEVGDRLVIVSQLNTANGWRMAREILVPGATGIATKVEFNVYGDQPGFVVNFLPEVAWHTKDEGSWGPARRFSCALPHGDEHVYGLRAHHVRLATDADLPLTRPADAVCWGLGAGCADKEAHASNYRIRA